MKLPVLSNYLYVPAEIVQPEHLDPYTYQIETTASAQDVAAPVMCQNCALWGMKWRKPEKTRTCADLGYTYTDSCRMYRPKSVKQKVIEEIVTYSREGDMYRFPRGDLGKLARVFSQVEIKDERVAPRLGFDIELKGCKLRPDQEGPIADWSRHGYGIIQAPTGFGKSVMFAALLCKLGLRTLVLADKEKHLDTVYEAIIDKTNIREVEEEQGHPVIGYLNQQVKIKVTGTRTSHEKFGMYYPITLSTYQSFNSDRGKLLLPHLKDKFGLVWHEESHHESAETFHEVTKSFNPWYRGGQTATPDRPDGRSCVMFDTIGPVVSKTERTNVTVPQCQFIHTGVYVDDYCFAGQYPTSSIDSWLGKSNAYFDAVLECVLDDIKADRKVLLFSKRKTFNAKLAMAIRMAGYEVAVMEGGAKTKGKKHKPQDWYATELREGRLNIIIGTSVIEENYNVPPLDCLHLPFINFTKVKEEQIVGRVTREVPGKAVPLVRVYTWRASSKMARTAEFWRRNVYKEFGFEIVPDRNMVNSGPTLDLD